MTIITLRFILLNNPEAAATVEIVKPGDVQQVALTTHLMQIQLLLNPL